MCTVSYLPLKDKVILTSNRDEDINRPALEPNIFPLKDQKLIYPKDPRGNGTWIAISSQNRFVCLLNGAFKKHKHQPPYRQSRGKVVTDYFNYNDTQKFCSNYNLIDIEPFTLIIYESDRRLYEFRWDGHQKYLKELDTQKPHIYSSSTLYTEEIVKKREYWFAQFLKEKEWNEANVLNFHKFAGDGNIRNNLQMRFDAQTHQIQTTSVTQIVRSNNQIQLAYNNLINQAVEVLGF